LPYKTTLSSIVLSQECCEVYFISLTVANPLWDLTSKSHWNRPPPLTLMGWICSWLHVICSTGNLNHCVASSIRKVCPQQLIART